MKLFSEYVTRPNKQGQLFDCVPSGIIGYDSLGILHGVELIRVTETKCIYIDTAMRNSMFPACIYDLLFELMVVLLDESVSNYFQKGVGLIDLEIVRERILAFRKNLSVISMHSYCGVLDNIS